MDLQQLQLSKLRSLIAEIYPANRFYAGRLEQSGFHQSIDSLEAFSERFPPTTKQDLVEDQRQHPPYGSNLTYPVEAYNHFCQTSASTGRPIVWLDNEASWTWMLENWFAIYEGAGVTGSDRIYFAFSFGPFLGFWTAYEAGGRLGCLCIPGGGQSSLERLEMILRHRVTVLCCTPTYVLRLIEVAQQNKIDLSEGVVKTILVAGEPGGSLPSIRNQVANHWPGAAPFDHYGMTEVGPVAFQRPTNADLMEVINEKYLAEVVDRETGQPVKRGEVGELILTPLGRAASPLLRYRTGDLVRLAEPSEPGAPVFSGGIIGRIDNMIQVRGVNVYPSTIDEVVGGHPSVAEYRVTLDRRPGLSEIEIEVELAPGENPKAAGLDLDRAFRRAFGLRIPVQFVADGILPRYEFKSKRWQILT